MKIYLAIVDTYEEIVGTADTPEKAVKVACKFALDYLKRRGVTEHKTIKDVEDYFGVTALPINLGEATFVKS